MVYPPKFVAYLSYLPCLCPKFYHFWGHIHHFQTSGVGKCPVMFHITRNKKGDINHLQQIWRVGWFAQQIPKFRDINPKPWTFSDPQSSFNAAVSPRLQRGLGPRPGRPWLAKVDSLRDAPVGESKWLGAEPPTMTLNDDLSIPSGKINYGK